MNTTTVNWLTRSVFPVLNALIYIFLFWLVASSVSRDPIKALWWSGAGFAVGLVTGFAIQHGVRRFTSTQKARLLQPILGGILLAEFALGFLLVAPFVWLTLRYLPVSNIHSICCETPLDYGAVHYENVHLNVDDTATIAGWYVAPTTKPGKVIILIHGYGYDRRGTDFHTRALIEAGYGVLLYDLRDHGESTGKITTFNRMQIYQSDLLHVVNYVKQKPEINPAHIGVVGISLGAFATLNSAPETLNSLAALWLDGLRFENFGARTQTRCLQPQCLPDYFKSVFNDQTRVIAGIYYGESIAPPPLTFAEIFPTINQPGVMLVSSGLDDSERTTNEKLIPLMGDKKDIWFIKNAWHIGGRFEVPDEYRAKMLAFFANAFSDRGLYN